MLDVVVVVSFLAIGAWGFFFLRGIRGRSTTEEQARKDLDVVKKSGRQPLSVHPRVDPLRCIGSGTCVDSCPEKIVLAIIDGQARLLDPMACMGHGECVRVCPVDAIQLVIGTKEKAVSIPQRNKDFETNVPGLSIAGELSGMGLIYNSMMQGMQSMDYIAKTMESKREGIYDVAIVGAGPAGLAATLAAKQHKLNYITLEQDSIGGTVLHFPRHKIVMTRSLKLPGYGKLRIDTISKEDLLVLWEDIIAKTGIAIQTQVKVEGVKKNDSGCFDIRLDRGEQIQAQRVLLALGKRGTPRKLNIPGEELGKVTYRLVDAEQFGNRDCLVVGGGDSAVEAALALAKAGARTHLAYRREAFSRIKPANKAYLDEAVSQETLRLLLKTEPLEIAPSTVSLNQDGKHIVLDNDYVLVCAGGVLPTGMLDEAGIAIKEARGEVFSI